MSPALQARWRPDAVLFQLFDAAIRASSGQNAQDRRFIIIRDAEVKRQLREWAMEGWSRYSARYGSDEDIQALPATSASRSSASATLRCTWRPSPSSLPCLV
ncbi:nitroreductase family protein [Candidatus Amarobacter glycogenicus]|uniref:nitroreductase family protein n=1 Tax=Candidatus Amarobacter glycogenicus TaxID=3140699 RepID=UPI002A11D647|nr:nitroreductase family protein [Dehalococcoidia bacterium]